MQRDITDAHQTALGAFLLGLAALAVFDFWFPGILLVTGLALHIAGDGQRTGWALIAAGGAFWLRDVLHALDMAALFPLVMIALGVALVLGVDLRRFTRRGS